MGVFPTSQVRVGVVSVRIVRRGRGGCATLDGGWLGCVVTELGLEVVLGVVGFRSRKTGTGLGQRDFGYCLLL